MKSISHYATASREKIAQMNEILLNPEQIASRKAVVTSGANFPVSNSANAHSIASHTVSIAPVPNNPVSNAANPDSNDENMPPPDDDLALSVVMQNDARVLPGLVPTNREISDKTSSSTATMMMANTSGLFHNASFHGCSFTMSFGK